MQVDREILQQALAKKRAGQTLTQREKNEVKKAEKLQLAQQSEAILKSVPKKTYLEMAGRQAKVVLEQADRYQLPLRGRTVDLFALVKRLHDFLAEIKHKLGDDDNLMAGGNSKALELYRMERYKQARLDRMQSEGQLLHAADVRDRLTRIAAVLRQGCEQLQKQFGAEAAEIMTAALEDAERDISTFEIGAALYEEEDQQEQTERTEKDKKQKS